MKSQALSQEELKKTVAILDTIKPQQKKLTPEQKREYEKGLKHYGVYARSMK